MLDVFKNTLLITSFVLTMMLIIEFINIKTRGSWSKWLSGSRFSQLVLAVILGLIPGCMGTYTIVSLYTHNIVSFGALVANLIATSGDEAFIMLSLIPETSILLFILLGVLAVLVGWLINFFYKNSHKLLPKHNILPIHEVEIEEKLSTKQAIKQNFRPISFSRAFLLFIFALAIVGVFSGLFEHSHDPAKMLNLPHELQVNLEGSHSHTDTAHDHGTATEDSHDHDHSANDEAHAHAHDHDHGDFAHEASPNYDGTSSSEAHGSHQHGPFSWLNITLLLAILAAMYIVSVVPDHFLEEHIWGHILKKHFFKIFFWTFGTLVFIHYAIDFLHLEELIKGNLYWVLLIALLIGIIPESGPHLVFLSLFIGGVIPFSILMANSIVQDGHGALPLLAESQKSFIWAKVINIAVGLVVGIIGLSLGF